MSRRLSAWLSLFLLCFATTVNAGFINNGGTGGGSSNSASVIFSPPGFRLSATSGSCVPATTTVTSTTLYYVICGTNSLVYYDGSSWLQATSGELTLALSISSGSNYDVFYSCSSATVCTTSLSSAYSSDSARANALALQDGVEVLGSDHTKIYVGTIRGSAANTITDSPGLITTQVGAKRFVWNRYNQTSLPMAVHDTDNVWSYTTGTWRVANGATAPANCVEYVTGSDGTRLIASVRSTAILVQTALRSAKTGVGVNSSTTPSGFTQEAYSSAVGVAVFGPINGEYRGQPGLGYRKICWLELGSDGATGQFVGDNGGTTQNGLYAEIDG